MRRLFEWHCFCKCEARGEFFFLCFEPSSPFCSILGSLSTGGNPSQCFRSLKLATRVPYRFYMMAAPFVILLTGSSWAWHKEHPWVGPEEASASCAFPWRAFPSLPKAGGSEFGGTARRDLGEDPRPPSPACSHWLPSKDPQMKP